MLGKHPLHTATPHDVAVRNYLNDKDNFLNAEHRNEVEFLNLAEDQAHEEAFIMTEATHEGDSHIGNEAKYKVFLESGDEYLNNGYASNLYRSFSYKYLPIPIQHSEPEMIEEPSSDAGEEEFFDDGEESYEESGEWGDH